MADFFTNIDSSSATEEEKIMLRECTTSFRSGFININDGNVTMPSIYAECYDKIFNFEVRDDDVFVITFPKCGTTWAQEMVWLVGNNYNYERAKALIQARFPFLEIQGLFEPIEEIKKYRRAILDSINLIGEMPSPRFIKCHLPWQLLPKQLTEGKTKAKMIYVSRNVKDCLVSYFNHAIILDGYRGNFDDFFKLFLANKLNYTPFWPHILDFWKRRQQENILFIKYENMKADIKDIILKVANFMGKECTEEQLCKLAEHLKFDNMKNNPAVNYEASCETFQKSQLVSGTGRFMRSGTVGSYKAQMTQQQIKEIDRWSSKYLENSDFI